MIRKWLIIFLLLPVFIKAQSTQYIGAPNTKVESRGQFQVDSLFFLPQYSDTVAGQRAGAIIYRTADKNIYFFNGTFWSSLAKSSDLIVAGTGLTLTGNVMSIAATGVVAGPYVLPTLMINTRGQVTNAGSGQLNSVGNGKAMLSLTTHTIGPLTITDITQKLLHDTTFLSFRYRSDSSLYLVLDTAALRAAIVSTPTWQQTLITGSSLTQDNTVTNHNHILTWDSARYNMTHPFSPVYSIVPDSNVNNGQFDWLKVNASHTYAGNMPFRMRFSYTPNGDGTDDQTMFIGYNIDRGDNVSYPSWTDRWEYGYVGNFYERHIQFQWANGDLARLASWTVQDHGTAANSPVLEFHQIGALELRPTNSSNYFASFNGTPTTFTISFNNANLTRGLQFDGDSAAANMVNVRSIGSHVYNLIGWDTIQFASNSGIFIKNSNNRFYQVDGFVGDINLYRNGSTNKFTFATEGNSLESDPNTGQFNITSASGYLTTFKNVGTNNNVIIQNPNASGTSSYRLTNDGSFVTQTGFYGSSATPYGSIIGNTGYLYTNSTAGLVLMSDGGNIRFAAGGNTEGMRFNASNELQIGSTSDQGAFTLQNTGGLYQNGSFSLRATPSTSSNLPFLVKGTDSLVYQLSLAINSGTYTPTFTNAANAGSLSGSTFQYMQVGSTVTVSGVITFTPASGSSGSPVGTQVGISLPVASTFSNQNGAAGTGADPAVVGQAGAVISDQFNNRAEFRYLAIDTVAHSFWVHFTYHVTPP